MKTWLGRVALTMLVGGMVWLLLNTPGMQRSHGIVPNQAGPGSADARDVQVVSILLATGVQQIVVVDAKTRTMAVYHIEPAQGKIQLKSVRNLGWDLQMEQFNGQPPLPSELRQVQP